MGVLISGQQDKETARQDFERLVSKVSNGEVQGVVLTDQPSAGETQAMTPSAHNVRRGAVMGACAGFLIGLIPLLASTILAAAAGGIIAKATELRFEKGSPPRLRFPRRRG
jgi:hypothetical protein